MFNRKGISPLIATFLLVVFSVGLGAIVMSWGETYIEQKAAFVQGASEVKTGCDAAELNVIRIGGLPQACTTATTVELWLENGPNIDLYNVHARLAGDKGLSVKEEILKEPLVRENAVKVSVPYSRLGTLLQVKLTPKVFVGRRAVSCPDRAITVERIPTC